VPALGARREDEQDGVTARSLGSLRGGLADVLPRRVADDEDVLVRADREAALDDRPDRLVEILGHPAQPTPRG
jgi:hypothetical protein